MNENAPTISDVDLHEEYSSNNELFEVTFDAIYDVADRWNLTPEDAEAFLEHVEYFTPHENELIESTGNRDTPHVGPVIFNDSTAREHFITHDEVITFRTSDRTTGDTWWRKTRTGPKHGNCHIERICRADPSNPDALEPYHEQSGFDSISDWQTAIKNLNDGLEPGFLYRVTHRPL